MKEGAECDARTSSAFSSLYIDAYISDGRLWVDCLALALRKGHLRTVVPVAAFACSPLLLFIHYSKPVANAMSFQALWHCADVLRNPFRTAGACPQYFGPDF